MIVTAGLPLGTVPAADRRLDLKNCHAPESPGAAASRDGDALERPQCSKHENVRRYARSAGADGGRVSCCPSVPGMKAANELSPVSMNRAARWTSAVTAWWTWAGVR